LQVAISRTKLNRPIRFFLHGEVVHAYWQPFRACFESC
jgi:hypothetical protein